MSNASEIQRLLRDLAAVERLLGPQGTAASVRLTAMLGPRLTARLLHEGTPADRRRFHRVA